MIKRFARSFAVVCLVLFAGEAPALEALDLVGEWKGSDNKIHRVKVHGYKRILLCRTVAKKRGGIRAYRGRFAQRTFELLSKPRTIGDLNHKLPAPLRRELIRMGASFGARVKIADKGRKLIVQYISGTVTWSRSDPAKVDSIKKIPGPKVILTHVITRKIIVEIARIKADRLIAALVSHNRVQSSRVAKVAFKLVEDFGWSATARRILAINQPESEYSALVLLEREVRWWKKEEDDPGKTLGRHYRYRIKKLKTMIPEVLRRLRWMRNLIKSRDTLQKLRAALPAKRAASAGLRDMKKMHAYFRRLQRYEFITPDTYSGFVRLYSRLKPELAIMAKSKSNAAKPKRHGRQSPWTGSKC